MEKNKERLKQQITVQKYFKEKEPRFLTFAETELIRKLYESNPEEWTRERLSESFPALPHTIQKILHSKWLPKSVEKVMRYDNVAVENWKKFKTGKLAVDPILNKHLMKFKDRKIILTDAELMAKQFVAPKPEFNKPKSQFFSNIVQIYSNEKQSNEKLLPQENDPNKISVSKHFDQVQNSSSTDIESNANLAIIKNTKKFTSDEKWNSALISQENSGKHDLMFSNKKTNSNKPLTFTEFVKTKLEDIYNESVEEGINLANTYRKQVEATISDDVMINVEETAISKDVQKPDKSDCATHKNKNNMPISTKENALDTYIKIRTSKIDAELEYAKPIKIAKHLHKPGMTYRINDCYYDDDGEFLYRVPGVQS